MNPEIGRHPVVCTHINPTTIRFLSFQTRSRGVVVKKEQEAKLTWPGRKEVHVRAVYQQILTYIHASRNAFSSPGEYHRQTVHFKSTTKRIFFLCVRFIFCFLISSVIKFGSHNRL